MKPMPGISFYSYLYLKVAKHFVFLIIAYAYSSKKLKKTAEQVLPWKQGGGKCGDENRRDRWPNVCTYE
jgi:hypothetical protein